MCRVFIYILNNTNLFKYRLKCWVNFEFVCLYLVFLISADFSTSCLCQVGLAKEHVQIGTGADTILETNWNT